MNNDETRKAIEVMQAYIDGAKIEVSGVYIGPWRSCPDPAWNWTYADYRIKPEPREGYVKPIHIHNHLSACDIGGCIKVREVIE